MYSPFTTAAWNISDFSGGITDNYLDGSTNQYETADNFLITYDKKLQTRGGSQIADASNYLPGYLGGNFRTNLLFGFEDFLWEQQVRDLYYNNAGYATMTGPTGNKLFSSGTSSNRSAWAYWNHHTFLVSDAFCPPQKLYKDGSGNFQIRTAGLPALATTPICTGSNALIWAYANDWKAKYNAHRADAAQHTSGADATNVVTAANATNTASLIALVTQCLTKFTSHEADSQLLAAWAYHKAKATASRVPASVVPPTTVAECLLRLNDLNSKFNAHDNDGTAHGVAGSHQQILALPSLRNYIYAFCYAYTYTVGTVTFLNYGTTKIVVVSDVDMPSDTSIAITGIPVIANGGNDNYDTTVITCKIFRTVDAGQTLYYVGQVTNGTTTYTDSSSDTTILNNNIRIYTDGGVFDADTPPLCKYLTIVNNIGWYAHTSESSQVHTNRVRQSIQGSIDSCPLSFYIDMEDEITGIGNVGIYPIVFCRQRIYRLEGFSDLTGSGTISKNEISRIVGCTSHNGIVVTLQGIFFPGNDGFYWTDGYTVSKISSVNNTLYASLQNKQNIYGTYDPTFQRIYWAVQNAASSGDNDGLMIADIKLGVNSIRPTATSGQLSTAYLVSTPFTTASASTSMAPTALTYFNLNLYRADKRGYLFEHLDTYQTDPLVDTTIAPSSWRLQTIIYNYISSATNFGSIANRKWVPKIVLYAKNVSNVSIGINSYNDDSTVPAALKEVRQITTVLWEDNDLYWGDPNCIWNYTALIKAGRNFPAGGLRCDYKQIQFTNAFTIIQNSDSLGTADVDSFAKTVVLNTNPPNIWTRYAIDYYISFVSDNYTQNFLIKTRTDSTLTYFDAGGASVTALATKWIIRGYRRNDVLSIVNYTMSYAIMSDTQDKYSLSNTGGNT